MRVDRFKNFVASKIISPKAIFIITVLGLIISGSFIYIEYQDRKKDLLKILEYQSDLFINTLSSSAKSTIIAADIFENEINSRIKGSLDLIEQLDRKSELTHADCKRFLNSIGVDELHVYNSQNAVVHIVTEGNRRPNPLTGKILKPKSVDEFENESPKSIEFHGQQERFKVFIVPRKRGGVIAALVSDNRFGNIRSMLGFGYFLKRFQTAGNVEYIVLQNSQTIIAGSFKNYKLSSFASDSLLRYTMVTDEMKTRILHYDDRPIFESIKRFEMYDLSIGVLRLGLSMHEYEQLADAARTRLYIFGIAIVIIGLIFVNFAASYRHRELLRKDIDRLQDYTNKILNNLQSGVISIDQKGIIQSINKQALLLLGYDIDDVYRKPIGVFSSKIRNTIKECMKTEKVKDFEFQGRILIQWKNRTLQFRADNIITDEAHKAYVIIVDDITKQMLLEEQVRQNERLAGMQKIAFSVAHEIRNPLTVISLIVDLIRQQSNLAVQAAGNQNIETLRKEINRIRLIVEKYLMYGKLPDIKMGLVKFPELLTEIKSMYGLQLAGKMILLEMDIKDHPPIKGDPNQLKQVFINLLHNAVDAIGEKGKIEIIGAIADNVYQIKIKDTGKGIPQKDLETIFDFNFTTKQSGSGIGLAIVKQILNAHHAQIGVESSEGKGTIFTLNFPIE